MARALNLSTLAMFFILSVFYEKAAEKATPRDIKIKPPAQTKTRQIAQTNSPILQNINIRLSPVPI
ncbi:MAG: hypothetical protein SO073_07725 [Candidatus Onthomonas sp.]|nr:hypothetical protein [Candidatus Onthomonas sp.]